MRICIDSCVFIFGLQDECSPSVRLLNAISPELPVIIPRLVAHEVSRHLRTDEQRRAFYRLFYGRDFAVIVDMPVPPELVAKYVLCGLRAKADAFIGAFAEWTQVDYLISCNRHFLRELQPPMFSVIDPVAFLERWETIKTISHNSET